jgi:hypothetical protein
MSGALVGDVIAFGLIAAAAASTAWVLHDARARGISRRKALTWAALQWIEFPLFLWLYRRIRPKTTLAARLAAESRSAGEP